MILLMHVADVLQNSADWPVHLRCCSTIFAEAPAVAGGVTTNGAYTSLHSADEAAHANNYSRPNGQNVSLLAGSNHSPRRLA